jgi:hypothetical protein
VQLARDCGLDPLDRDAALAAGVGENGHDDAAPFVA